jgi:GAF domain-containing protein
MFFRKRLKGIAEIRRVAREADATTDARAIMELACQTVKHALDPLGVAFYLHAGDAYTLAASCDAILSPSAYAFNDAIPLRLRRWQEPFEIDDDSDARHHMLFLPMTLRGDVTGFLCCGPKPDRTPYIDEEIEVLALLAHQVGIAAVWLRRTAQNIPTLSIVET